MKATLIIAYYKNLAFLDLILQSLGFQSEKDFEVIIAEDDNVSATKEFLNTQRKKYSFAIHHISQDNNGFRKNKILNLAIQLSESNYLIFIDGDCVLHQHFIKEHLLNASHQHALIGRRLMLSKSLTHKALKENRTTLFSLQNFIFYKCKLIENGLYLPFIKTKKNKGIIGCNWSAYKKNILAVNGFDEDYIQAGVGEDVDIEWRLRENGLHFKSIKFKAIQYHLHHKLNYTSDAFNIDLLKKKQKLGNIFCVNGIKKPELI